MSKLVDVASSHEDRIIVKALSGSNYKFSTRVHVEHFPFREFLLLINIHCHFWKCLSLSQASQEDWTFEFELYGKVAWQVRCLELIGLFTKLGMLDQAFHMLQRLPLPQENLQKNIPMRRHQVSVPCVSHYCFLEA